jgi:hypothetical protein
LLISDQNLWWGKQENESYRYKSGNTFASFVLEHRPELRSTPIVVYTDSPMGVTDRWKNDGIDIFSVVEKYNYNPNDTRKPWEILADTVRSTKHLPNKEGNEGSIRRER